MTKYSLGYHHENKDSSVCLFEDNKLIYCKEEERFTRTRHANSFPYNAINAALDYANIKLEDLSNLVGKFESSFIVPHHANQRQLGSITSLEELQALLKKAADDDKPAENRLQHHLCHAMQAYATSGFKEEACFLVVDGCGDCNDSISIGTIDIDHTKLLASYSDDVSIGALYSIATTHCGFDMHGEGKLMGLSSYGTDTEVRCLKFEDGKIKKLMSYDEFFKKIYPFCAKDSIRYDTMQYANFARTVQEQFNEIILAVLKHLSEITTCKKLVLAGGCMQNCIANNLICESGLFEEVYCSPIPYDGGTCIGECFINSKLEDTCRIDYPVSNKEEDIDSLKPVEAIDYSVSTLSSLDWVAKELSKGQIFGWFQGGSEFGPRALGHRSFLANPAIQENLYYLNKIKSRELWRPLAPVVPEELFDEVFDVKSHDLFQFMLRTTTIRPEYRQKLAAVCHVDGTTRPQLLKREWNPELYDLIMTFYKLTGVPALVNTSLNTKCRPMVETLQDLFYEVLLETNIPIVVNCKYVLRKTI